MQSVAALGRYAIWGACVALLPPLQAGAKATYEKIWAHRANTQVERINNGGTVAGRFDVTGIDTRAFIKAPDGRVVDFAVDGAVVTIPRGLTDAGAVGGRYDLPDDSIHGFFRDSSGTLTAFDGPGLGAAEIAGMNAGNDIAGTYFIDENQNLGGFIRHQDGAFTSFRIDEAYPGTLRIAGINRKGEIAGYYTDSSFVSHAFLRQRDGSTTTFDAPEGKGISVYAINDKGWTAGFFSNHGALQGFVRKRNGEAETFYPPGAFIAITAMNNEGDVTGCYARNFRNYGFIRKAGGKMIGFGLPWGQSEAMCAQSINEAGQVAGYVRYGSFGEKELGFVRTP
ncbi:MAG: hypothetical protein JO056_06780 [Alphaproteobacteria bacterium]|nr:hypothetical protein [Alphaproteobacteria bacterium]